MLYVSIFQVGLERTSGDSTYRNVLTKLTDGPGVLELAYGAVENLINQVRDYVGVRFSC